LSLLTSASRSCSSPDQGLALRVRSSVISSCSSADRASGLILQNYAVNQRLSLMILSCSGSSDQGFGPWFCTNTSIPTLNMSPNGLFSDRLSENSAPLLMRGERSGCRVQGVELMIYLAGAHRAHLCVLSRSCSFPDRAPALIRKLLDRNVKRFREELVFKSHRLLYHSTLGWRVIQKKKKLPG